MRRRKFRRHSDNLFMAPVLVVIAMAVVVVLLSGCATPGGIAVRAAAITGASGAYDESLTNAEFWVCRGASAGSVIRRYGASEEQWRAWKRLCRYEGDILERPVDRTPATE